MEFRGVSLEQDRRFSDKNKRIRSQVKAPKEFETKVDLKKVHLDVLRPWIAKRVTALLGFEDDVVIQFVMSTLEEQRKGEKVDPIDIQINLTGFLERNTPTFMAELWRLLISAQNNYSLDAAGKPLLGVPQELLEEKKAEIITQRAEAERVAEELRKKRLLADSSAPATGIPMKSNNKFSDMMIPPPPPVTDGASTREKSSEKRRDRSRSPRRERSPRRDRSPRRRDRTPPPRRSRSPRRDRSPRRRDRSPPHRSRSPRRRASSPRRSRSPPRRRDRSAERSKRSSDGGRDRKDRRSGHSSDEEKKKKKKHKKKRSKSSSDSDSDSRADKTKKASPAKSPVRSSD